MDLPCGYRYGLTGGCLHPSKLAEIVVSRATFYFQYVSCEGLCDVDVPWPFEDPSVEWQYTISTNRIKITPRLHLV